MNFIRVDELLNDGRRLSLYTLVLYPSGNSVGLMAIETSEARHAGGLGDEFCPYCGVPTCPHCGTEQARSPGRPRKLLTLHERELVTRMSSEGAGVRRMANAINKGRREQYGPNCYQVTYWTLQGEVTRQREAQDSP